MKRGAHRPQLVCGCSHGPACPTSRPKQSPHFEQLKTRKVLTARRSCCQAVSGCPERERGDENSSRAMDLSQTHFFTVMAQLSSGVVRLRIPCGFSGAQDMICVASRFSALMSAVRRMDCECSNSSRGRPPPNDVVPLPCKAAIRAGHLEFASAAGAISFRLSRPSLTITSDTA